MYGLLEDQQDASQTFSDECNAINRGCNWSLIYQTNIWIFLVLGNSDSFDDIISLELLLTWFSCYYLLDHFLIR